MPRFRRVSRVKLKRFLDVVVAVVMIAIASLPMAVIALLVRLKLGRPVLFRHSRPGIAQEPFELLKFRTMTDARDVTGRLLPDSERQTKFGNSLRKSSLDELPALLNVLRGEMSLVGPRPLIARYAPFYRDSELTRFSVNPGLTGWAQVHGRNSVAWDERLALDVWYVNNQSLLLDFRILIKTVLVVLTAKGVETVPNQAMLSLDEERNPENGI